jgi:hypothetical protein
MGLTQLVKRVGLDKQREEGMITTDKELIYFEVLSSLLKYNRLKLIYTKALHEEKKNLNHFEEENNIGWIPDLHNMINSLDNMSFSRVYESLEKLVSTENGVKRHSDMVIPLELYKEMICYLRILLESSDETHNEFAVARLFSIFFTGSDRKDPLPRLLSQWAPGIYGRKHLHVLVEVVHETMKTLDSVCSKYGSGGSVDKKKKVKAKKSLDMEQFMAACLNFDVEEYFKRYLATNSAVRMYTRLLTFHSTNGLHVNHYAYCYLQRLSSFRLHQEYSAPPRKSKNALTLSNLSANQAASSSATAATVLDDGMGGAAPEELDEPEPLTLGHLLFNLSTLSVFTDILSDSYSSKQKANEPLIRLIKSVIRRFEEACLKNHTLFAEAFFQHGHAQDVIVQIDNVYEASSYAAAYLGGRSVQRAGYESDSDEGGDKGGRIDSDNERTEGVQFSR